MIVRCIGCEATVSEWAARCHRCGRPVEESIAEAHAAVVPHGPKVLHGLVIGDAAPDERDAMWTAAASARPVWERSGLPVQPLAPAEDVQMAEPAGDGDAAPHDQPEAAPKRRRTWAVVAAVGAAAIAVAALAVVVVMPQASEPAATGDVNAVAPILDQPELRWSAPLGGQVVGVVASDDTVYAMVVVKLGGDRDLVAFDRASGVERWRRTVATGDEPFAQLTPSPRGIVLTEQADESSMYLLDAETGAELWRLEDGWYPMTRIAGERFAATRTVSQRLSGYEIVAVDAGTGEFETIGTRFAGAAGRTIVVEDSGDLVAYDALTMAERGRWNGVTDSTSVEAAITDGDDLVVLRNGRVVRLGENEEEWTLRTHGGDANWLLPAGEGRMLAVVYSRSTYVELLNVDDEPAVVWSERANLMWSVAPGVVLVESGGSTRMVRVTESGFEEIADLGSPDDVGMFFTYGVVLTGRDEVLRAVGTDGTTRWELDVDPRSVYPLDEGLAVAEGTRIDFYS